MEPSGFSLAPQTRIGLSVIARRQAKNAVEDVDVHPGGQPIVGSVITGGVRDQIVNERQPQAIPANHTVGDAGGRISRWQSIAKVPKMPISALPEIAGARSDEFQDAVQDHPDALRNAMLQLLNQILLDQSQITQYVQAH
jgi:hypothetical protein